MDPYIFNGPSWALDSIRYIRLISLLSNTIDFDRQNKRASIRPCYFLMGLIGILLGLLYFIKQ